MATLQHFPAQLSLTTVGGVAGSFVSICNMREMVSYLDKGENPLRKVYARNLFLSWLRLR